VSGLLERPVRAPPSPELYIALARRSLREGKIDAARSALAKAKELLEARRERLGPVNYRLLEADIIYYRAEVLTRGGERAEAEYRKALQKYLEGIALWRIRFAAYAYILLRSLAGKNPFSKHFALAQDVWLVIDRESWDLPSIRED